MNDKFYLINLHFDNNLHIDLNNEESTTKLHLELKPILNVLELFNSVDAGMQFGTVDK